MHRLDQNREVVATDVLAQVAEGTGGEFFHNNNDLKGRIWAIGGISRRLYPGLRSQGP